MDGILLAAASSVLFCACSAPIEVENTQQRMGRSIQEIVGGTGSGGDQDAVVVLARFDNGVRVGFCTATVVATNLLVTARHCVSATDPSAACGPDGQPVIGAMLHGDRDPATLAVYSTAGGALPDTTKESGATARGKTLVVDAATSICNRDVAYLVLDRALSSPIAPVRLGAASVELSADVLTAVGFGITEVGALPASRMQRTNLSFLGVGPMPFPEDARYGVGDRELLVGESACLGDSGGPVLAKSGAVVGVASRAGNGQARDPNNAASTCLGTTAHAVYASLGADKALALRAFAQAGASPWLEGQPDPNAVRVDTSGTGSQGPSSGQSATVETGGPGATAGAAIGASAHADLDADAETSGSSVGCSASGEPTHGAVEHALGIITLVLLALRLRRRGTEAAASKAKAMTKANAGPNGKVGSSANAGATSNGGNGLRASVRSSVRIPYVDLGMRESLASISDEG